VPQLFAKHIHDYHSFNVDDISIPEVRRALNRTQNFPP
jgi:hypothetical protein